MKSKTITIGAIIIFSLAALILLSNYAIPRVLVTLTKAAPGKKISLNNSYVLGEKILAKADGKDNCIVNVFLLDEIGKGVANKEVILEGMEGIESDNFQTNVDGKASFRMSSNMAGQFKLTASVEGVGLPQGVTVTFR